jgi:hypothetical protein
LACFGTALGSGDQIKLAALGPRYKGRSEGMAQTTASSTNILMLVNSRVDVSAMPEVLVKLNELTAKPDTSVEDIAKIISADPAVSKTSCGSSTRPTTDCKGSGDQIEVVR